MSTPSRSTYYPDVAWLARHREPILEPELPIVDPHHHLWERKTHRYLLPELLADTGSGHNVVATVFVECVAMYRPDAPPEMRSLGETEFVNGTAAMSASGIYGPTRACAGIVGFADLTRGEWARPVLEAHVRVGGGRFRGIRHAAGWDASPDVGKSHTNPPQGLYRDATFRQGFAQLAPLNLSFDAWLYHPQLGDLASLARAFPSTAIVVDHVGGPIGVGPYKGKTDETYALWLAGITELAACSNVTMKLGGLGMRMGVFDFHSRAAPPSSEQLAQAWQPWIDPCIEAFGPRRCMFESNFPVDGVTTSYAVLWNAFKRLAGSASATDKDALFSETAKRVYRL
jgi:predicted TIM-barrel fold metal-dependent hydrolase